MKGMYGSGHNTGGNSKMYGGNTRGRMGRGGRGSRKVSIKSPMNSIAKR